jgi:glycosyltransferase involved in cell wall biosynthesis
MEFSVIVPTLNEQENILNCLKSIKNQSFPRNKYEIIVSDGNSSDKTVEIARKYADKVVVTRKKGIWYGRNFGARFAKGKYLVFIDGDTTIDKDYLKTMHKYMSSGYVCVSCGFHMSSNKLSIKMRENYENLYHRFINGIGVICLLGFSLCVPKDIFSRIGGFKNIPMEDNIFGKEARKFGKTAFIPEKLVTTSSRRLEKMGSLDSFRYYLEIWLISNKLANPKNRFIKFKKYKKVSG